MVNPVTNGAGANGAAPCGTGVTSILNGQQCTVECEAGFHPSAPTATCNSGTLDAVTCVADVPCPVNPVTNGAGANGAAPCGTGVTSIVSGEQCTVDCEDGYRAVPTTATCSNGVIAARECRVVAPCTVAAVTNAAGVNGAEPCGAGITSIYNGEQCTVECAAGFDPSAATATCNAGTLDTVTCYPDVPCQVGTVANALADAAGMGGASPCGAGVTSINSGDNCNVQCADGYYPTQATSACTNGAFALLRECTTTPPQCTVAAVANAAGVAGASPCGAGITSIANAGQCEVECAAGYHSSPPTATCTGGVLDPISCVLDVPTATQAPDDSSSGLLIGLALLALGVAAVIAIVLCLNQKPKATKPKASKRAVKPVAPKVEPPKPPPAPPPAPTPTQSQPVAVMRPMTSMVQVQPQVQTIAAPAQARAVAAPLAQAVQVAPTLPLQQSPSSTVVMQNAASPRMVSISR